MQALARAWSLDVSTPREQPCPSRLAPWTAHSVARAYRNPPAMLRSCTSRAAYGSSEYTASHDASGLNKFQRGGASGRFSSRARPSILFAPLPTSLRPLTLEKCPLRTDVDRAMLARDGAGCESRSRGGAGSRGSPAPFLLSVTASGDNEAWAKSSR